MKCLLFGYCELLVEKSLEFLGDEHIHTKIVLLHRTVTNDNYGQWNHLLRSLLRSHLEHGPWTPADPSGR